MVGDLVQHFKQRFSSFFSAISDTHFYLLKNDRKEYNKKKKFFFLNVLVIGYYTALVHCRRQIVMIIMALFF